LKKSRNSFLSLHQEIISFLSILLSLFLSLFLLENFDIIKKTFFIICLCFIILKRTLACKKTYFPSKNKDFYDMKRAYYQRKRKKIKILKDEVIQR